jgi:glycosyltransferase involved in cell wall biosynthesis
VSYLADALPARLPGVQVEVLDTYGPGSFWLMPGWLVAAVVKLVIAGLRGEADLAHVHMATRGSAVRKGLLAVVARWLRVPTVLHIHGSDFDEFFLGLRAWQRRLLVGIMRRCDRVVVIGGYWREFAVNEAGLDPGQVVLIHNGAPLPPPPSPRVTGAAPRLLALGLLGPRKGTGEVVAALATPELRRERWTATIAGNGLVDQYRSEVAALGLSDRIHLPGWQSREQVRALLQDADILLLPSRQEGLPMAILEAMAGGVAVVSTPVGAIPDAIVDGETGLLVPPGEVAALAGAVHRLLGDPGLRQRLADNARARFEAMFTIERTADLVAALYRDLGMAAERAGRAGPRTHRRSVPARAPGVPVAP